VTPPDGDTIECVAAKDKRDREGRSEVEHLPGLHSDRMSNTGRSVRCWAWWVAMALALPLSMLATARDAAPGACTLMGKVPVVPRKTAGGAKGNYEGKGVVEMKKADAPASAVWMVGAFPPVDPARVTPAVLAQEGLQFKPALLVVQVGTPVSFPNRDPIYHNVVSFSAAKKFDLGRFKPGDEPPPLVFDKPGTVPLRCEVHDHMVGAIVVVDSPHFTKSDADGNFRLEGLPAGMHTFRVWLTPKESLERTVELRPGQTVTVDWTKPA
jgi:plastocyanin